MTWLTAAVLIDLGYYWFHRASHEIGVLWAVHQVSLDWELFINFKDHVLKLYRFITAVNISISLQLLGIHNHYM